jgi:hypothetical protein
MLYECVNIILVKSQEWGHSTPMSAESVESYVKHNFPCEWYKTTGEARDTFTSAIIRKVIPRFVAQRIILLTQAPRSSL